MMSEVEFGFVSRSLEAEVSAFVRKNGIVIWLDSEGIYSGFVDRLKPRPDTGYRVEAFRGSYLELLMALLALPVIVDDLLSRGHVAGRVVEGGEASRSALWARVGALTGLPASWRELAPS